MPSFVLLAIIAVQVFAPAIHAISLDNFQPAPSGVSTVCSIAYGAAIAGCSSDDFSKAKTCSSGCQTGLLGLQHTLSLLCASSSKNVPSDSLLAWVLAGDTISVICEGAATSSSSVEATTTSATTTKVTPSSTASTASQQSTSFPLTTKDSTSTQPTATLLSVPTSSLSSLSSSTIPSIVITATGISSSFSISSSTFSSSSSTPTTTSTQPAWKKMSAHDQQVLALANSGGGSPFDIVVASGSGSSTHSPQRRTANFLYIFVVFAGMIVVGG